MDKCDENPEEAIDVNAVGYTGNHKTKVRYVRGKGDYGREFLDFRQGVLVFWGQKARFFTRRTWEI
jgi:hypothetical protein